MKPRRAGLGMHAVPQRTGLYIYIARVRLRSTLPRAGATPGTQTLRHGDSSTPSVCSGPWIAARSTTRRMSQLARTLLERIVAMALWGSRVSGRAGCFTQGPNYETALGQTQTRFYSPTAATAMLPSGAFSASSFPSPSPRRAASSFSPSGMPQSSIGSLRLRSAPR